MATKVRTIADLRNAHDKNVVTPRKVSAALAAMLKEGAEMHEYETDFMKRAVISNHDLTAVRKEFVKHVVIAAALNSKKSGRNVWFADAKVAAKVCKDYPNAFRPWTPEE